MKRINLYITDNQAKEIANITKKTEITLSEIVRRALDEYISKIKNKSNKL